MVDKTTVKQISAASLIMMASIFGSRVIGIFRESAISGIGGLKASVDAYQVAFVLPEILNHYVASGFLSVTFIPIFAGYLKRNQLDEGYRIFSLILNTFGLLLAFFITIAMIKTELFLSFLAPGLTDQQTIEEAVKMTRIILPAQLFFFGGGLLMAIQFANNKFFIPALGPLIYNGSIIAGGLVFGPAIGMEGFAWGALAGAFLGNFALQIWAARKLGARYSFVFSFTHPDMVQYVKVTLPLIFGLTMSFSTEILFKYFGSYLNQGSIAAMNYCLRIMLALVALFGQSIGVAAYPAMARLAQEKNFDRLNGLLNSTLKFIFLIIPISVLCMTVSREIIMILLEHGAFDAQATARTAGILPYFFAGAFAFSALSIVSRGFYATQNTITPAVLSTIIVILTFPMIYLLMRYYGPKGVAAGLSFSAAWQIFTLYEFWNRRTGNTAKTDVYKFFLLMLLTGVTLGIPLYLTVDMLRSLPFVSGFFGAVFTAAVTAVEFVFLFIAAGYLFKIKEIHQFCHSIFQKVLSWKKKQI